MSDEKTFREEMEKIKKILQEMIPNQVDNVAQEIDKIVAQAIVLKDSGNKNDTPKTYTHLCLTLINNKTFWRILEQTRKVLVIDFLEHDVPPAFRKGWNKSSTWVSH